MSLIDDFQRQIDARLSELQPAFAEYTALQQLRGAIANLDPDAAAAHVSLFPFPVGGADGLPPLDGLPAAATAAPPAPPKPPRGTAARKRRAARSAAAAAGSAPQPVRPSIEEEAAAHEQRAIDTVAAEPGLTAVQLAERMDVAASVLFRLLPTLQREGRLRKQGKGYYPV